MTVAVCGCLVRYYRQRQRRNCELYGFRFAAHISLVERRLFMLPLPLGWGNAAPSRLPPLGSHQRSRSRSKAGDPLDVCVAKRHTQRDTSKRGSAHLPRGVLPSQSRPRCWGAKSSRRTCTALCTVRDGIFKQGY